MKPKTQTRTSSHRAGQCAQHYHLIRLDWISPLTLKVRSANFEGLNAQFFVADARTAQVMVTMHEGIKLGTFPQKRVGIPNGVRLAAIAYSITACSQGRTLESEKFIHRFKAPVFLSEWRIRVVSGKLWTWRRLSDLLDSKRFGNVEGAQFLA